MNGTVTVVVRIVLGLDIGIENPVCLLNALEHVLHLLLLKQNS
jgi:hypothetical protein